MDRDVSDIVKSPEALRMLEFVTKNFYSRSYTAQWLFEVIGREYDEMAAWSRHLAREIFPQTCTWSIGLWEWVYGLTPGESFSLDFRRRRVIEKIIGDAPVNPETIRRGVENLTGFEVIVTENTAPYSFIVDIFSEGKPWDYAGICRHLQNTKPAHLALDVIDRLTPTHPTAVYYGAGFTEHIRELYAEEGCTWPHSP